MVVVADRFCTIRGYQWQSPNLTLRWEQSHTLRVQSSPSVSGDRIMLAGGDGAVRAYDLQTGDPLWEYKDKDADKPLSFVTTPAHFISPIYAVDVQGDVYALNLNGQFWRRQESGGYAASSLALTRNLLYLINTSGFYAYSLDLAQRLSDSSLRGGMSTPAIGPDGEVYVAGVSDGRTILRAYRGPSP